MLLAGRADHKDYAHARAASICARVFCIRSAAAPGARPRRRAAAARLFARRRICLFVCFPDLSRRRRSARRAASGACTVSIRCRASERRRLSEQRCTACIYVAFTRRRFWPLLWQIHVRGMRGGVHAEWQRAAWWLAVLFGRVCARTQQLYHGALFRPLLWQIHVRGMRGGVHAEWQRAASRLAVLFGRVRAYTTTLSRRAISAASLADTRTGHAWRCACRVAARGVTVGCVVWAGARVHTKRRVQPVGQRATLRQYYSCVHRLAIVVVVGGRVLACFDKKTYVVTKQRGGRGICGLSAGLKREVCVVWATAGPLARTFK